MKRFIKNIILVCLAVPTLTACLEEAYPGQGFTQDQLPGTDNSVASLSKAIPGAMLRMGSGNGHHGYAGLAMDRDCMGAELPVFNTLYDLYGDLGTDSQLDPAYYVATDWWYFYYELIYKANLTLKAINIDASTSAEALAHAGNALGYRAFAYYDMAFAYEYKKTGYEVLDKKAEIDKIYGLTVPIRTESTTQQEATTDRRAPFYVMYRFIMTDLDRAEKYLQGYKRSGANMMDQGVIFGIKARLWLQLGTRFEKNNDDLQMQLSHENDEALAKYDKLGITSANDCFKKAAQYARLAISEGHRPLTKAEWFNSTTGFNTANEAWLLAVQINSSDMTNGSDWNWKNFVGNMSSENTFGVNNLEYKAFRMIDAGLYKGIENGDWRKNTWIAPADAGQTAAYSKYTTLYKSDDWVKLPAYTGLKFHPRSGEMKNYKVGAAVDIPLMRAEEIVLIEAEAKAHYEGLAAGKQALTNYLNTYRYDDNSYQCTATTMDAFNDEILRQKRIEFWGEGIVFFDYKRLEKAVIRHYEGSNHPTDYQWNTKVGFVAPRMNICISHYERQYNANIVNNPDPSGVHEEKK